MFIYMAATCRLQVAAIVPIAKELMPVLQWLEHLDVKKKRVDHIEKVIDFMP